VNHRKTLAVLIACTAGLLAPGPAQGATLVQEIYVDSYENSKDGLAGPRPTASSLAPKGPYYVDVAGTYSIQPVLRWKRYECGDDFRRSPMFPTDFPEGSTKSNYFVGYDAEIRFARPGNFSKTQGKTCLSQADVHHSGFRVDTGDGRGLVHPEPMGGTPSSASTGHTYRYAIVGNAKVAQFGIKDPNATDNYGRLRVRVSRASTEECKKDGWKAWLNASGGFVYKDQGDCQSNVVTDGRNPPTNP
jgi:hypothetical protein